MCLREGAPLQRVRVESRPLGHTSEMERAVSDGEKITTNMNRDWIILSRRTNL